MAPSAVKVSSSARALSKLDARRLSEPAANNPACSGANQARKTSWRCAVSTPAAGSTSSGKNASTLTAPATIAWRFRRSRRILSCAPLIESWVTVLEDYSKQVHGDRPWWYRERTQVGFLAVAAWRGGGIAIEEWGTTKYKE